MAFNEVIELISITSSENELGDPIEISVPRDVFANKKSISQTEFYQAQTTGLRPEIKFEIWSMDYQDEPKFSFNNKTYTIIRTFEKDNELIELVGSGTVNKGDSNG
ncbi:phage head closure protein [Cytobacillus sp. FSL H8-0458]|uniref:phage head closure protein n=1 Tax=Cytobacillus sp. FSL H8-0458 TaxID=2975346 RepID=UPI0030F6AC19